MKYRVLSFLFLIVFIGGMLWSVKTKAGKDSALSGNFQSMAQSLMSNADRFKRQEQPFPHIKAFSKSTFIGYIIFTEDLNLGIQGYSGPVPLILALDLDGKILNIKVLTNNETPSYTGALEQFIQQFLGKTPKEPVALKQDVDAITGATVTSSAVTRTIRQSLDRFSKEILRRDNKSTCPIVAFPWLKIIIPIIIFVLAGLGIFLTNNFLRWSALISGMIFFGIMTGTMLSIVQVANLGIVNIPDWRIDPLWYMLLGLTFFSSFLIGRIYCGSICPFASIQEWLFKCSSKKQHRAPLLSPEIDKNTRWLKYILLLTLILLVSLFQNSNIANVEPFVTLFKANGAKLAWTLLALMLIMAIFNFRFWCKYLCPVGALTGLAAKGSLFKILSSQNCSGCGECANACPTNAITEDKNKRPKIDEAECILCSRCLTACPEKCLKFRCQKP